MRKWNTKNFNYNAAKVYSFENLTGSPLESFLDPPLVFRRASVAADGWDCPPRKNRLKLRRRGKNEATKREEKNQWRYAGDALEKGARKTGEEGRKLVGDRPETRRGVVPLKAERTEFN